MPVFNRLRFVLVETSRPGNIGAAARAMKTMGFTELVLVNPRVPDAIGHEEAVAFASGAQDILAAARIVGIDRRGARRLQFRRRRVSARLREFSPPVLTPRTLAAQVAAEPGLNAALIFGNERFGLPNQVVEKCNVLINIPANPEYSSLNLAQAVQVLAYECRIAALGDGQAQRRGRLSRRRRQPGADRGHVRAPGAGAGGDRFPRPRQSEKADAAPEAPVRAHAAGDRGGQYPARHRHPDFAGALALM